MIVALDTSKLEELYNSLGWHAVRPQVTLSNLDSDTYGEFDEPDSVAIDPENIRRDYATQFHKELVRSLGHELGHFFNLNYTKGFRHRLARWYELYQWTSCLPFFAIPLLIFNIDVLSNTTGVIFSLALFTVAIITAVSLGFCVETQEERNADAFGAQLLATHGDLLKQCITVQSEDATRQESSSAVPEIP